MKQTIAPFKFSPILKSVLWGGDRIAPFKALDTDKKNIGESWEISAVEGRESVVDGGPDHGLTLSQIVKKYGADLVGKENFRRSPNSFPLLVKFIDARRDLSLQVHPDDELAQSRHNCNGKTEMWYIIDCDPGAKVYSGMSRNVSPDEYERRVADNSLMEVVSAHESYPGAVFYVPAGRIHAIGSGNFLVEIQQTSDISYRIYDYGRRDADGNRRELHISLAKEAIDYGLYDDYILDSADPQSGVTEVARCKYFDVRKVSVDGELVLDMSGRDSFVVMTCIDGDLAMVVDGIHEVSLHRGETVLVPASAASLVLTGKATCITATT
ncbi:MAG: class I mannose-6-phosphate isomerase [Pseudoflavonifractor sp.]|nr:class I mannose-6-phosphate isomerase [Pseudoflavonifractor sp.]